MPPRKKPKNNKKKNRATDIVPVVSVLVAMMSLGVAYSSYQDQGHSARLQRTQALLHEASKEYSDNDQRSLLFEFKGRWDDEIKPMTADIAETYFNNSLRPTEDHEYKKWNAARRHLNTLEDLSTAYVRDLADKELLAAATCLDIVRSRKYFAALIERFTRGRPAHGWLVIPEAADMLEKEYGPECKNLKTAKR